jgi:hypothetical protein
VSPNDWQVHVPKTSGPLIKSATVLNGLPTLALNSGIMMAGSDDPQSASDWLTIGSPDGFLGLRIVSHGGLPAFFDLTGGNVVYDFPTS